MYITSVSKKRKIKTRKIIAKQLNYRLTVYKSNKHIYSQIFTPDGSKVILSMSSIDNVFLNVIKLHSKRNFSKIDKAFLVGKLLAEKLKNMNIKKVVFDRSGFKFHGRIKAIADSIFRGGIVC